MPRIFFLSIVSPKYVSKPDFLEFLSGPIHKHWRWSSLLVPPPRHKIFEGNKKRLQLYLCPWVLTHSELNFYRICQRLRNTLPEYSIRRSSKTLLRALLVLIMKFFFLSFPNCFVHKVFFNNFIFKKVLQRLWSSKWEFIRNLSREKNENLSGIHIRIKQSFLSTAIFPNSSLVKFLQVYFIFSEVSFKNSLIYISRDPFKDF